MQENIGILEKKQEFIGIQEWLGRLHFLIPAVIAQMFNPIAKVVIPIEIPTKEAKAEMETHPVIVEIAICKW